MDINTPYTNLKSCEHCILNSSFLRTYYKIKYGQMLFFLILIELWIVIMIATTTP